jgi:hypothetical protein
MKVCHDQTLKHNRLPRKARSGAFSNMKMDGTKIQPSNLPVPRESVHCINHASMHYPPNYNTQVDSVSLHQIHHMSENHTHNFVWHS